MVGVVVRRQVSTPCGLEVIQTRQITASIRLTETTATQVDQYAAFIHASADDIVEQALAYVFSKDCDFQEFLKSPGARLAASTLRIRKAPVPEAAEPSAKKPANGTPSAPQPAASVAGLKAHDLHPDPRQGQNGASHRNNIDNAPFRGESWCRTWRC
jgi:hypothetical protein